MFTQTLEKAQQVPAEAAVVCDLGTGPYLLFARPQPPRARESLCHRGSGSQNKAGKTGPARGGGQFRVEPGVIELVCGFSPTWSSGEGRHSISEIAGSIASEEGVYGVHAASLAFNMRRWRHARPPRSHDKGRARALRERTKEPRLLRALLLRDLGRAGHGFVPPLRRLAVAAERRDCFAHRLARQLHAVVGRSC